MTLYIKVSGKTIFDRGTELLYGKMVRGTRDIGLMINSMVKVHFIIMKATFSKVNLEMEKQMVMENIIVKMVHNLKVNIKMDKNMVLELIHHQMEDQEWVNGSKVSVYNGLNRIKYDAAKSKQIF